MNTVYISTKMSIPEKVGEQNTGCPSTSRSRENVPLSTHGSTPMLTMTVHNQTDMRTVSFSGFNALHFYTAELSSGGTTRNRGRPPNPPRGDAPELLWHLLEGSVTAHVNIRRIFRELDLSQFNERITDELDS